MDKIKNRISIDSCYVPYGNETRYEVTRMVDSKLKSYGEYDSYDKAKRVAKQLGQEMRVEVWSYNGCIWTVSGKLIRPTR